MLLDLALALTPFSKHEMRVFWASQQWWHQGTVIGCNDFPWMEPETAPRGIAGSCLWSGQISPNEAFRPFKEQKVYKDVPAQEGVLGAVEARDGPV